MTDVVNEEMAAAWDGPDGDHWTVYADHYERVSRRHWARLVDRVQIPSDAAILDVGCGTGRSSRDLARIAVSGHVVGVDLSSRMLEHGREQARSEGLTNVRFEQADAEVHAFAADEYDLVVSVFGSMFFGDPIVAFGNLRSAANPGGALALLTWRELSRNEWLTAVRDALAMGRFLPEPQVSAPGPLGLADPNHVRQVLEEAGYSDIRFDGVDEQMTFGRDADDAITFISSMGLTKALLHDLDADTRSRALEDLRQLVAAHESSDGVLLGSSAWLVTARA